MPISSYEHIHPTELEYAKLEENDCRNDFLKYMRDTLYKRDSFSLFSSAGRETGCDRGRINAVLSKVESVWRLYPDMRLGQLLLCVCGNQDFFSMEDEELMCKLQYNQIPIDEKGNDEFTRGGKCDGKEHILGICDGMEIIQKEKKEDGVILEFGFDDKKLTMYLKNNGEFEVLETNMYKAQVYYNTHTVKKWYFKYIFLRM